MVRFAKEPDYNARRRPRIAGADAARRATRFADGTSHRLEARSERTRNRGLFGPALERDHRLVAPVAPDAGDCAEIADRPAMDLPEAVVIDFLASSLIGVLMSASTACFDIRKRRPGGVGPTGRG